MDWRLFFSTFGLIFLAELGDKTQLATLSLAAGSKTRWVIFFGSALALIATSALAVLLGGALNRWIPAHWVRRAAGALFVVLGLFFLFEPADAPEDEGISQGGERGAGEAHGEGEDLKP